jgi:hypothetical protein
MTERYKTKILEKIKNSTITHVANEECLTGSLGITPKSV